MATVYAVPDQFVVPGDDAAIGADGRFDVDALFAAEERFCTEVREWARSVHPDEELVGEVIRFPQGDGYALYMILSLEPAELVWLPLGDAWQIPAAHAKGLDAADLRDHVESARRLAALFARPTAG